jgi:hypothetical protein
MFDDRRDSLDRHEIGKLIDQARPGDVAVHKLVLSPGVPGVDLKDYAREVMGELSSAKGQDLQWAACIHRNTEHDHMHVVVLGRDRRGSRVKITREDHDLLRYKGDKLLERDHAIQRELDREVKDVERVIKERGLENTREKLDKVLGKRGSDREIEPAHDPIFKDEKEVKDSDRDKEWTKERAIENQPDWAKIEANGRLYTKFNSSKELKELDDYLNKQRSNYIDKKKYAMMHGWIKEKNEHGEHWHEEQDRKRFEKYKWWHGQEEERDEERFDRTERTDRQEPFGLQPPKRRFKKRPGAKRRKGGRRYVKRINEREYQRRGRDTVHDLYVYNMAKERLIEASIRNPQLKETFDKELKQMREFRREIAGKVEVIDLEQLIGGKNDRHKDRQEPDKTFDLKSIKFDSSEQRGGEGEKIRLEELFAYNTRKQELIDAIRNNPEQEEKFESELKELRELRQKTTGKVQEHEPDKTINLDEMKFEATGQRRGEAEKIRLDELYAYNTRKQELIDAIRNNPEQKERFEEELRQLNEFRQQPEKTLDLDEMKFEDPLGSGSKKSSSKDAKKDAGKDSGTETKTETDKKSDGNDAPEREDEREKAQSPGSRTRTNSTSEDQDGDASVKQDTGEPMTEKEKEENEKEKEDKEKEQESKRREAEHMSKRVEEFGMAVKDESERSRKEREAGEDDEERKRKNRDDRDER